MILVNKYLIVLLVGCLIEFIDAGSSCKYYPSYPNKDMVTNVECQFLCCNSISAKNEEEACCNKYWIIGISVGGVVLLILLICVISVILCCCGIACSCLECLLCPCRKICC